MEINGSAISRAPQEYSLSIACYIEFLYLYEYMETSQEIRDLANRRLEEAKVLIDNSFFEGAIYLAGYSVELSLKAKICDLIDIPDLFNFGNNGIKSDHTKSYRSHDLERLVLFSGLRNKLQSAKSEDIEIFKNWSVVCEWSEDKRYCKCGLNSKNEADRLVQAITDVSKGIKTWIERH